MKLKEGEIKKVKNVEFSKLLFALGTYHYDNESHVPLEAGFRSVPRRCVNLQTRPR